MNIITSLGNNIKLPVVNSLPTNLDEGTLCVYQDKLYVGDGDNLPVIAGEEVDLTAEIGGLTAKNVVVTGDGINDQKAILAADVAPLHLLNRWLKIYRLPFFSPFKDIKKRAAYYI